MKTLIYTIERPCQIFGEEEYTNVGLIVEYEYTPGTPDVYTLPNGDPGYPGDPEEIEILSAIDEDGKDWGLEDYEIDAIEVLIREIEYEGERT